MSSKTGRNAPCWCGSGKKFKKCHLGREDEPRPTIGEVFDGVRGAFDERRCLHPSAGPSTCRGGIIQAHTIQRGGGLTRIARASHVYSIPLDISDILRAKGRLVPKLVGIKKASTFTGFCGSHDATTFAPLETAPFDATPEQIFLLLFRALCRDLFAKRGHRRSLDLMKGLDRGLDVIGQLLVQDYASDGSAGADLALSELETAKTAADAMLLRRDYSRLRYYVLLVNQPPDVMVSGVTQPEQDFWGRSIQDLGDLSQPADWITVSAIATDVGGALVFAWLDPSPAADALVRSLAAQPSDRIPDAFVRYAFETFENLCWSPVWWEQLASTARQQLERRIHSGMSSPHSDIPSLSLADDGTRYVDWQITGHTTNLALAVTVAQAHHAGHSSE